MNKPVRNQPVFPFTLETQLERAIAADSEWLAGLEWGKPRPGHPEGKVKFHIRDVLNNVDHFFAQADNRLHLRLIALIHDTFKYQARAKPGKSHGYWASKFAAKYISDKDILQVIELHDQAYKASLLLTRHTDPTAAKKQATALIAQLGHNLNLFMHFYLCDNRTGDKSTAHYEWFRGVVRTLA